MVWAMFASTYDEQFEPFASAWRAWLAADFDRCVTLCVAAEREAAADNAAPIRLLHARALIRLGRASESVAVLEPVSDADADGLVRVLRGTALVRSGKADAGLRILREVVAEAPPPEIAGEALLGIAVEAFNRRCFDVAEHALAAVAIESGSIAARVAEYRGWIGYYSYRLDEAVEHFRLALQRNAAAPEPDPSLGANVVYALAYIATERMDASLWANIERWASRVPGLHTTGSLHAYRFAYLRSVWLEVIGRPADALGAARQAETYAPSDGLRLNAGCRRAAILFRYGEHLAYHDLAVRMRHAFEALDPDAVVGAEEAQLWREVAEALALLGDVDGARWALARREAARPPSHHEGDRQEAAIDAYVAGMVADAAGETLRARHAYERAFHDFKSLGLIRRATMAALIVAELTGDAEAYAYAGEMSRLLPPDSWMRIRFARIADTQQDPIASQLTRAQREVLTMLAAGMSTAAIADARGRSLQTTRNTISTLLRLFRAQNRQMLVREFTQRGIPPATGRPASTKSD